VTEFPTYDELVAARTPGDFDMVIANDRQVSNTPFTYFDYMFHMPVDDTTTSTMNYGRYENEQAWELVQELDRTPVSDVAGMQAITSQLEQIFLEEMPQIPLWYNGPGRRRAIIAQLTGRGWGHVSLPAELLADGHPHLDQIELTLTEAERTPPPFGPAGGALRPERLRQGEWCGGIGRSSRSMARRSSSP
jgi:hypothetical protein